MGCDFRTRKRILGPEGKHRGQGLFSHIRDDTTTRFQDFVGLVVAIVFLVLGSEIALLTIRTRAREFAAFGSGKAGKAGKLRKNCGTYIAIRLKDDWCRHRNSGAGAAIGPLPAWSKDL